MIRLWWWFLLNDSLPFTWSMSIYDTSFSSILSPLLESRVSQGRKYSDCNLIWLYTTLPSRNSPSFGTNLPPAIFKAGQRGSISVQMFVHVHQYTGTAVAQWLRCCATNRKVAVSIPVGVSGFFIDIKSFRLHYDPGIDSASNINEYQELLLGVKAAGA